MTREAELELEIARLRKFILTLSKQTPEELSTSHSTTALQELINEVERRTIEQCAVECDTMSDEYEDANPADCAEAIRALPTGNLKLEDLS